MEFQVINRNRNAVIPEGMFKLCGMEDAKLISMVQLNGGILLMPESVSTYQLLMLIDAVLACRKIVKIADFKCARLNIYLGHTNRAVFSSVCNRGIVGTDHIAVNERNRQRGGNRA